MFEFSSVAPAPTHDVFDWHGRPGAIRRLSPPWLPMQIQQEADSLRDGVAILRMPTGIRWVATHQPDGYLPDEQFVDALTSRRLSTVVRWQHTHQFESDTETTTRVTDSLRTNVPEAALRSMFAYRHRQLAADLNALRRARVWDDRQLTVAVTGSSGFVGTQVCALLGTAGHQVVHLVRRAATRPDERQWDPDDPAPGLLNGVDAVVHLAGAPIAGRFTASHKAAVRDSRVGPTRRLAQVAATAQDGPSVFVSASAIGYYGADRGDEELTESAEPGTDFLADVVTQWEAATYPAADAGLRTVQVRTGIVQSPAGGTLRLLRPLFAAGLGGRLGGGRQWQAWIGIDDLADIYLRALLDEAMTGPVNAVAPNPVRNAEYTRTLARIMRRPAVLPVPDLGPRILLGSQGARELAMADQKVIPARLQAAGHVFRHPHLGEVLSHVLGQEGLRSGPA